MGAGDRLHPPSSGWGDAVTPLLAKPEACFGCPMYGDGLGFVPDRLVGDSEVTLLAQNPGADEEGGRKLVQYVGKDRVYVNVPPQPLIGPTGYALEHTYLPLAGLSPSSVSYCYLLKCRDTLPSGGKTNVLPKGKRLREATEHCTTAHLVMPGRTRLVIAHGGAAWDFTQLRGAHGEQRHGGMEVAGRGRKPLSEWRGYLGSNFQWCNEHGLQREWPVYATLHTASLFRSSKYKPAARADWAKVPRVRDGSWPTSIPVLTQCPSEVSLESLSVQLATGEMLGDVTRVALDTEYLYDPEAIPGEHPLSVIGVAGKDSTGAWQGFQVDCRLVDDPAVGEFIRHVLVPHVFKRKPVVFQNAGADIPVLAFNSGEGVMFGDFTRIEDLLLLHAELYSEQPHDLEYLASVAGILPHTKHFLKTDILLRNLGDVVETLVAFEKFEKEGLLDKSVYKLYTDQLLPLVPIHTEATRIGLAINREMVDRVLRNEIMVMQEALRIARAYVGFPLKIGSVGPTGQLASLLYHYYKMPVQIDKMTKLPTVDGDALAVLRHKVGPSPDTERENRDGLSIEEALSRCSAGANPLLEARVVYAAVLQEISHYLAPCIEV